MRPGPWDVSCDPSSVAWRSRVSDLSDVMRPASVPRRGLPAPVAARALRRVASVSEQRSPIAPGGVVLTRATPPPPADFASARRSLEKCLASTRLARNAPTLTLRSNCSTLANVGRASNEANVNLRILSVKELCEL